MSKYYIVIEAKTVQEMNAVINEALNMGFELGGNLIYCANEITKFKQVLIANGLLNIYKNNYIMQERSIITLINTHSSSEELYIDAIIGYGQEHFFVEDIFGRVKFIHYKEIINTLNKVEILGSIGMEYNENTKQSTAYLDNNQLNDQSSMITPPKNSSTIALLELLSKMVGF